MIDKSFIRFRGYGVETYAVFFSFLILPTTDPTVPGHQFACRRGGELKKKLVVVDDLRSVRDSCIRDPERGRRFYTHTGTYCLRFSPSPRTVFGCDFRGVSKVKNRRYSRPVRAVVLSRPTLHRVVSLPPARRRWNSFRDEKSLRHWRRPETRRLMTSPGPLRPWKSLLHRLVDYGTDPRPTRDNRARSTSGKRVHGLR